MARYLIDELYVAYDRKGRFVYGGETEAQARDGAARRGVARVTVRCERTCGTHPTPVDHRVRLHDGDTGLFWRCTACGRTAATLDEGWRFLGDRYCPTCGWLVSPALVCSVECEVAWHKGQEQLKRAQRRRRRKG